MRMQLLGAEVIETGTPPGPGAGTGPLYSMSQFEQDLEKFKPRIFDTYILPGFMMFYAWKSKDMKKTARRILFTAGVYMMYRNYSEYKKLFAKLQALIPAKGEPTV